MSSIAFDTHKYVKDLLATGMPEARAEVFIKAQHDILSGLAGTTFAPCPISSA